MPHGSEPTGADEALAAVDRALARGDWGAALRAATDGLSQHAGHAELLHARGVALRGLERPEEALDAFLDALQADEGLLDAYLDTAELLIEDLGEDVRALEILDAAQRQLAEGESVAELSLLRGVVLAHLEDLTGALEALDEAVRLAPDSGEIAIERGSVLLELLRIDEAEQAFRRALRLTPEDARGHQLLAFLLDFTGRREAAVEHFAEAGRLEPTLPVSPSRLSEREFDAAVDAAVAELPRAFRRHLANVEISVENYPDRDFCRRHDCSPTTLGIYVGTPLTLREGTESSPPDRIVLFQRSLENLASDEAALRKEIVVTLKHEVGHLLGLEEDELRERGYE